MKIKKLLTVIPVTMALAVMLTACGTEITTITLDKHIELTAGDSMQITAEYAAKQTDATSEDIEKAAKLLGTIWTSADESIAVVDDTGTITGVSAGTTTITVSDKYGKLSASATVVIKPALESVAAEDTAMNTLSMPITVAYRLLPSGAEAENITMAVADESIATVKAGRITPVAAGHTTLTITADGKTVTAQVDVAQAPTELAAEDMSVSIGGTKDLAITTGVDNAEVGTTYTYASSAEAIATVDANGVVTGKAAGTTIITVVNELGQSCNAQVTVGKTATTTTNTGKTSSTATSGSSTGDSATQTTPSNPSTPAASTPTTTNPTPAPTQPDPPAVVTPDPTPAPTQPDPPVVGGDYYNPADGVNVGDPAIPGYSPEPTHNYGDDRG